MRIILSAAIGAAFLCGAIINANSSCGADAGAPPFANRQRVPPFPQGLTWLNTAGPLELKDGRLTMRLLVDRASVEVFGNEGKLSLSSCFVPQAEGLEAYCTGGNVRIVSLKVYELKSAWK
jgi:sucrose-6-phosphate hydrolase SacC (GH32 family)